MNTKKMQETFQKMNEVAAQVKADILESKKCETSAKALINAHRESILWLKEEVFGYKAGSAGVRVNVPMADGGTFDLNWELYCNNVFGCGTAWMTEVLGVQDTARSERTTEQHAAKKEKAAKTETTRKPKAADTSTSQTVDVGKLEAKAGAPTAEVEEVVEAYFTYFESLGFEQLKLAFLNVLSVKAQNHFAPLLAQQTKKKEKADPAAFPKSEMAAGAVN